MQRPLLILASLVLLAAVTLVAWGSRRIPEPKFTGALAQLLPPPPAGWAMKEKAIADTPEMKEAVGELLNFDDGVFVDYLGPAGERISLYVAYWTPGRMSHRLVAVHTPDVCWVGAGWKKTAEGETDAALPNLPTGEARIFEMNGAEEHVWFWHLVGGEAKRYDTGGNPPWYAAITDILGKGLNQREEQFFIRVSSNKPVAEHMKGPVLPAILRSLPWPTA